jgi:hypothetical protein
MPFYRDHIYPYLVDALGDPPLIQRVRRQIIPLAQGTVLEIGVGSGANFRHYDPATERIALEAGTVDTVVSTFTLCTILSPDPAVRRWQKRLEPVHHRLFQGLYLTQDIPSLIKQGGFQIEQMETGYLARFPKSSSHCWWGTATPR